MSEETRLVIPSDTAKLYEVDEFAEEWIRGLPFNDDELDDIAISLSEAVNNAILHGNKGDISKKVTIELIQLKDGIMMRVTDQGGGFDPSDVKDPTQPDHLLDEAGRGLLIIRHLMDEVNVKPSGNGTRIELIKRFSNNNN